MKSNILHLKKSDILHLEGRGSAIRPVKHLLLLWMLILSTCLISCSGKDEKRRPLTPVAVVKVKQSYSKGAVAFSAGIVPCTQVNVAFKSGGYVEAVLQVTLPDGQPRNVQEGDMVKKGTVLARVRQKDYLDNVAAVRSQLTESEASLAKARKDFTRAQNLYKTESITQPDYDAAKANYQVAQAQRNAAGSQLSEAQISLQDASLKSPLTGVVLQDNVEVGTLAGEGTVGFVVADILCTKAIFGVPGTMLGDVKLGQPLEVTIVDAIGARRFKGTITEISPSADPKSRVFDVEVTIPNPENRIKFGMIASLSVGQSGVQSHLVLIPLSAVVRPENNPAGYAVYVIEEKDGQTMAELREVKLGEVFGNEISVTEGLRSGDSLITRGATLVHNGEQVRVIPSESGMK